MKSGVKATLTYEDLQATDWEEYKEGAKKDKKITKKEAEDIRKMINHIAKFFGRIGGEEDE